MASLARAQFTFTTNNGAITITGYNTAAGLNAVIPASTNGYPVVSVGTNAFQSSTITNVTIPNSVTNIGNHAFRYCYSLTSVTVPNNVTSIGSYAFSACTSLTNVTIGSGVTSIGNSAFYNCSGLTSVTIGSSVTDIGNSSFQSCSGLASVTIPNSVANIGDYAFYFCNGLTNVTLGSGVTTIGYAAFAACGSLTNVTIPNSVIIIGGAAFFNCTSLASVTIPNSVTSIGYEAFFDCTSLTSVTIGSGVTTIGVEAFYYCTSLTNITVDAANPAFSSLNGILFDKAQTTVIQYAAGLMNQNYSIPTSVTTIGSEAFRFCYNLTSVTIGGSVTTIGPYAFESCVSLTNITVDAANPAFSSLNGVLFDKAQKTLIQYALGLTNSSYTIPNSVTSIGFEAFFSCTNLTSVAIGSGVTTIGDGAFARCASLTGVAMGSGVTIVGGQAFQYCTSLTNITFQGNAPTLGGSYVFLGVHAGAKVYYYYGTSGWSSTYGGLPTVMLYYPPQVRNSRILSGNFGFTLTGVTSQILVVEASTNLLNWQPIWTNTLSGISTNFIDPLWANYPQRFYRAR